MILVDGRPMNLPEVMAWLRARYGVSEGPIFSSERL